MYKNIELETSSGITVFRINRPKVLNALNEETLHEIQRAFKQIETSSETRVVILTGSGEKAFMVGADLLEVKDKSHQEGEAFARLGQAITEQMEQLPQPIIAAVNGYALGGGCEFAMACDFILAAEKAVFGQPEVALGITPFFGGCYRLARYVGLAKAKELIYTGKKFTAQEAKEMGLVLEVVAQENLLTRAKEIAKEIQQMSFPAVASAKSAINQIYNLSTSEGLKIEAKIAGSLFATPDQREGMQAFAEKRKPIFKSSSLGLQ